MLRLHVTLRWHIVNREHVSLWAVKYCADTLICHPPASKTNPHTHPHTHMHIMYNQIGSWICIRAAEDMYTIHTERCCHSVRPVWQLDGFTNICSSELSNLPSRSWANHGLSEECSQQTAWILLKPSNWQVMHWSYWHIVAAVSLSASFPDSQPLFKLEMLLKLECTLKCDRFSHAQ